MEAAKPLSIDELNLKRLSLGLPLLLLEPLETRPGVAGRAGVATDSAAAPAEGPGSADPTDPAEATGSGEPISAPGAIAIEPEQQPEDQQGSDLDQQIL